MSTLKISRINRNYSNRGSALVLVSLMIVMSMVVGVAFLSRSGNILELTGLQSDSKSVEHQLDAGHGIAKGKLERAIGGMALNGKLQYVGGPNVETFNNISNSYAATALEIFKDLVQSQAYSPSGTLSSSHEFANFNTAFPSNWTDPDLSDGQYYEVKYTFTPLDMVSEMSPQELRFEYEYRIQVRAYGQKKFQSMATEDSGVLAVTIRGAPFSQWAAFMYSMKNQNGSTLVFAGGNTSAQVQEVYGGPVHVNQTPYFYGHPVFLDRFTSSVAEASWVNYNVAGYTCCANFNGGKQGAIPSIDMPTQIFNTQRLAAGDTSSTAPTNNSPVTNTDINSFLAVHATGTVAAGAAPLAEGIYIPIDNSASKNPTGGIYVQGDAKLKFNVVQGSSTIPAAYWSNIQGAHQSCKFQKVSVTHLNGAIAPRDIFIADDPCQATYVFDANNTSAAPVVLAGRINGNIHVNGKVDEIGGESRTRPAIATDFGITVSAQKDIRIVNDLQYEDAQYKSVAVDGSLSADVVADPYGQLNSSGILPTAERLAPVIDGASKTTLGLVSTGRNIYIHINAPSNINIHAALFAGNNAAYNAATGLGCGAAGASTQGCGFGYEGWNSKTGMGSIKFLGALAEYKDQTTGVLSSPPKGYASLFFYDRRLRQDVTPPAFPVSNQPMVSAQIRPYKTWRISKSSQ